MMKSCEGMQGLFQTTHSLQSMEICVSFCESIEMGPQDTFLKKGRRMLELLLEVNLILYHH